MSRPCFLLWLRAISDNFTHGLVAAIAWIMSAVARGSPGNDYRTLMESLLCLSFACLIDIDHILAARSFHIKDIISLHTRPLFHLTSLMVSLPLVAIIVGMTLKRWTLVSGGWILMTAVLTHHMRDGLRRGIWLWPSPSISTPPVPTWLYYTFLFIYPIICGLLIETSVRLLTGSKSMDENFNGVRYELIPAVETV